jgi:hypothetical protein
MSSRIVGLVYRKRAGQYAGQGFIGGILPPGGVTSNGAAAAREVEVRARDSRIVVATTFASSTGAFRVDQLAVGTTAAPVLYDVIGRDYTGTYEDVIVSRVQPVPYAMSSSGAFDINDTDNTLDDSIQIAGGVPALSVSIASGTAPTGVTFALVAANANVAARQIVATGTASSGSYTWTLRITDADGRTLDIPCSATFT